MIFSYYFDTSSYYDMVFSKYAVFSI